MQPTEMQCDSILKLKSSAVSVSDFHFDWFPKVIPFECQIYAMFGSFLSVWKTAVAHENK
jgi:hypothetical protein